MPEIPTSQPSQLRLWRKRFALALFSFAFSIVLAEGVLRVTTPEWQFADSRSDAYWKARFQHLLKNEAVWSPDIEYDSDLGWRMRRLYQGDGVQHNSRGFRGDREYTLENGRPRILSIGDSQTYGLFVNDESTYCSHLEEITGAQVINAGVNGYGVDQAFLMWELEGKKLHPEIVVLGYFVDNFYRNALPVRGWPKPYFAYDAELQKYDLAGIPVLRPKAYAQSGKLERRRPLRILDALSFLNRRSRQKLQRLDYEYLRRVADLSENILSRLRNSVEESGAQLIVVFIGNFTDGIQELIWVENSITEFCGKNNIDCINLASAMRDGNYPSYFENNHLSKQGHLLAAQAIAATASKAAHTTGLSGQSSSALVK